MYNASLKAFILLLSTTGLRANEALSLRNSDIDFNDSITKIHIRASITKTKRERKIYTTNECAKELKQFLDSKYKYKNQFMEYPDHLIFMVQGIDKGTGLLYPRLAFHFHRLLDTIGLNQKKDGENRRKISFHSFRRYLYSTISDIDQQYADFILGHTNSVNWIKKKR